MLKRLLAMSAATLLTVASYAATVELREDHPQTYVVKRGDTLWDIAARFLKQPWLWPEIWQANPQIENPHRIYPGDEINLAYLESKDQLHLTVVKRSPEVRRSRREAIPPLPLANLEPFLKKTRVFNEEEYKNLPYVVGLEEARLRSTGGQVAYVRGLEAAKPGQRYAVVRPTVRFAFRPYKKDPQKQVVRHPWNAAHGAQPQTSGRLWAYYLTPESHYRILGYEVIEISSGEITRGGDPATLLLANDSQEVKAGDLLMPIESMPFDLSFQPHAPETIPGDIRILAATGDSSGHFAAPDNVVALSAGAADGLESGHVLAIYEPGQQVRDEVAHPVRMAAKWKKVTLPDEFVGHVMIFRAFDHVSYGLIMDGIRPARVGDSVTLPSATD